MIFLLKKNGKWWQRSCQNIPSRINESARIEMTADIAIFKMKNRKMLQCTNST